MLELVGDIDAFLCGDDDITWQSSINFKKN